MFLTAVLQAHTDSLPPADTAKASSQIEDTVTLPARFEETLTLPTQERLQLLPSAHRSRWV